MGCLYKLIAPNGKGYIGITIFSFEKRLNEHLLACRKGVRSALYSSLRLYGIDAFTSVILHESDSWEELCALEKAAIVSHGTLGPHGYNMTTGGDGVLWMPPASRERHRKKSSDAAQRGWDDPKSKAERIAAMQSPEFKERHRKATSEATKAAFARPEVKQRLLAAMDTPEYKAKKSAAIKALWTNPDWRANQIVKRRGRSQRRTEESIRKQSERMKALIADRKAAGTYWN